MSKLTIETPRPDLGLPDAWATAAEVHHEWLREACPQLGLDTHKVILASLLGFIYGDDPNCFGMVFQEEYTDAKRRSLEIRMDWEIRTPETPQDIRERLQKVKGEVFLIDWSTKEGWKKAKKLWTKKVANYVQHQVALHPEYREAIQYYNTVAESLSAPYQEFLGNP